MTAQIFQELQVSAGPERMPTGVHFRAAGPIPGGWRVIGGWDSVEDFQTFYRERVLPRYEKAGVQPTSIAVWTGVDLLP